MCLIVDVNVAEDVLLSTDDPDFADVHVALFGNKLPIARVVYGGRLLDEYNGTVRKVLLRLDQAGRARMMPHDKVDLECATLQTSGLCISNDAHIIALARVGKVRLLCSRDRDLHTDFCNKRLIDKPRGKVYQSASHKRLLARFCRNQNR